MLPANRTFVMRQTSKTMCAAVENAKLDTVVVRRSGVKFPNGEGLQDKLNGLNAWCKVTVLYLNDCGLQERGAQAIADVLRVNTTLTELDLRGISLGEGVKSAVRQSWGNRGGTLYL